MFQQGRLKDKFALITGAGSGIGFHIAKEFLAQGANVGVHYHHSREGAERLLGIAQKDRCKLLQADFSESHQVLRLWDEFLGWSGTIDILVNNAGEVTKPVPLSKLTEEILDKTFQINMKAPILLSQVAVEVMKQKGWGRIVNISSIGVKFGGGPMTAHYSASKAALEAVMFSFAKEGASHNILVNAIRAGVTDTPLHQKMGRTDLSERTKLIPLGRMAQPEEIAHAALFLASEESSFITGSILSVAGGE